MSRVKYFLLSAVVAACVGFALICVVLASLPSIACTSLVQSRLKQHLALSLKRSVAWSNLDVSWSGGVSLSGLSLGRGAAPLLTLDVGEVIVVPSFGKGSDGRYGAGLHVRVKDVRAGLAPGPAKPLPPKPPKDPLTLLAEAIQKVQGLDWPLPLDLRVDVDVTPVRLSYTDSVTGKSVLLEDFSFRYDMPSLAARPVEIRAGGILSAMGRSIGRAGLTASVSGVVTRNERLHPASALLEADAALPGGTITIRGGLDGPDGLRVAGKFDLSRLHQAFHPFFSPKVPVPRGVVSLDLTAQVDPLRDLHAKLALQGQRLAVTGGAVKSGVIGPLEVKLDQQVHSSHKSQLIRFSEGKFSVPGMIEAEWTASVKDPSGNARRLDLVVGPVRVDLARAMKVAGPVLPRKTMVRDLNGTITLSKAAVHLEGSGNNGTAEIEEVRLVLPRLLLALPAGAIDLEEVRVVLERAAFPLKSSMPSELAAGLAWSVGKLAFAGKEPVTADGLRGDVDVVVKELNLKSRSPRRVTLSADVRQSLDCAQGRVGNRLSLTKLHEGLHVTATMGEQGDIDVSLPEALVAIGEVHASHRGRDIPPFPLAAHLSADDLHLPPNGKGRPALRHAKLDVTGGNFLNVTAEAALSPSSPQVVSTSGKGRLDLGLAAPLAAPFMPKGMAVEGRTEVSWRVSAPLPTSALPVEKNALRLARGALALVNDGEVTVSTAHLNLKFPAGKGPLLVTGVTTTNPLRFTVARNGDSIRLSVGAKLEEISGLSGKAGELPVRSCGFTFEGNLSQWRDFRFNEELQVDSLGLNQVAELTVDRIDPLLQESGRLTLHTLLKRLDVALFTNLDASFPSELRPLIQGVDVAGKISAGGRVNLAAGRDLRVLAYAQSRDFGLRLQNGTALEGLRSDLVLDRVYALAMPRGEVWTPLSTGLVRPVEAVRPAQGSAEIARRISEDLRGEVMGARTFRIRKMTTLARGLPIMIRELEGDILLTPGGAGLSFLQGDVLGGTVRASGTIDMRQEVPVLSAACAFTNLDSSLLVPQDAMNRTGREKIDAEVSGEMLVDAPLATDQRDLLEGMRMRLSIHKIGSRTLERALFSLDPYERNEQILSQRRLLRLGGIKWLRAGTVDGALNVEGEALVKGTALKLPSVERVRLSELPIRKQTARAVASLGTVRRLLDLARADTILIQPDGKITLKRSSHAE